MNTTEQQFSQLVRDNRSTIYAVCYMFSNDADEVADLFQEVLVKLWNGYESFHGKSDIKTWIYRVTLNTCIHHRPQEAKPPESLAVNGCRLFQQ